MQLMLNELEKQLKLGDESVLGDVFTIHRPRIWQIVHFRLNHQVRGRVDPDDVVQEVFLAAKKRLPHFVDGHFPSFFLWLRLVAGQTLSDIHRRHLTTEARSAFREALSPRTDIWGNTSACLSHRFVAHITSPSCAAVKVELIAEVRKALDSMNEIDREVLALRHFEELTNQEVATELGISQNTSSTRYMRALERLRSILEVMR
ncbi:MAG: sigma-70 family RNA polymerase sigma factor [Fuerstiella sp.]